MRSSRDLTCRGGRVRVWLAALWIFATSTSCVGPGIGQRKVAETKVPANGAVRVETKDLGAERRGVAVVVTMTDGTTVEGRFRGSAGERRDSLMVEESGGTIRGLQLSLIDHVDVYRGASQKEQIAGAMLFLGIFGAGYLTYVVLTSHTTEGR